MPATPPDPSAPGDNGTLQVEATHGAADLRVLARAIWRRGMQGSAPQRRLRQLVALVAWLVVAAGLLLVLWQRGRLEALNSLEAVDVGCLVLLACLAALSLPLAVWGRFEPSRDGALLGPTTYRLDPRGYCQINRFLEPCVRWEGVDEIEETPKHILLWVDRCAGYVLPKRAFASNEAREDFLLLARTYHAQARSGGAAGADTGPTAEA